MAQKVRDKSRDLVLRYFEQPGVRVLDLLGFSPNMVTVLGLIIVMASAATVSLGHLSYGGGIFLAGSVLDMFDGSLARLTNRVTVFGSLLDSLFDRIGEAVIFLGLAIYGVRINPDERHLVLYFILLIVALGSSQCVSYLRAKGEALSINMRGGLMTRPERVLLLSLGLLWGDNIITWVLGIIAVLSVWTLVTRVMIIRREVHGLE